MAKVKYIKTKNNKIIVFGEYFQHSDFEHFEPITAGFISIGAEDKHAPTIKCYGESISLRLKADEKIDSELARFQILGYEMW